jgi:hypothetical protein
MFLVIVHIFTIALHLVTNTSHCNHPANNLCHYYCRHLLIYHGNLLKLTGQDIMDQFIKRNVMTICIFDYLISCLRHDDIVHHIDAAGYRIFVTPEFFVSSQVQYTLNVNFYNILTVSISVQISKHTDALEHGQTL